MDLITTTHRRIARRVNRAIQGGFCVFSADGGGGYWYSANSHPTIATTDIKFWVPDTKITARQVAEIIDCQY
jgi:hypothetical protein